MKKGGWVKTRKQGDGPETLREGKKEGEELV